ncbi:MAG: LPS assembly protein LptD, partial [candidate division Zixibacteria bacterium]|nr:LPS assembly protein LptD [candidate division Zixibacteria bacterium]
ARPVVFYIEKIPLMIVPYYVFSTKRGRHSGFLPFHIGNFEKWRNSISNVGYYWAASEYWDITTSMDYYENYGFAYHSAFRYNQRYNFTGALSGSYANDSRYINYKENRHKRWAIVGNHSHTFSPTFNLKADGTFISDKSYYTDFSTDLGERLNRNLRSQISISKRWEGASLSAQVVHSVDLDLEKRTDELPTASLSFPKWAIFGSPSNESGEGTGRKWYHSLYFGYSAGLRNHSSRSTSLDGNRSRKEFLTVNHSPSLSMAPLVLFNYLRIGPSFSYQETWYKIFETDQSRTAGIDTRQLYRRYAYSGSISASTDLYGTVNPGLFGLTGLRHVITPNISYSWAPEITRHNDIRNYTGAGSGGAKSRTMSFSLRQLLQAKVKSGDKEKTYELLTLGSNLSYNFEAKDRKFSQLNTDAQTSLLRNIRISAGMVHDLYEPGTNRLHWQSPYLMSLYISTSFTIAGSLGEYESPGATGLASPLPSANRSTKQGWSLWVSHYYSEYGRGANFVKIHSLSLGLNLNLTPNWKINYRQSYDVVGDRTVSRTVEIERKLHCWRGYFYWTPNGSNRGYYFRINVIAIPDIKFEKSQSGIRGAFL